MNLRAILGLAVLPAVAAAQCPPDWRNRTGGADPVARNGAGAAFDGAGVVMFGGDLPSGRTDQTWLWREGAWQMADVATRPSRRYQHGMAYDAARGRVVLFGGYGPQAPILSDTWEWDGAAWGQRTSATSPPARYSAAMAYDSVRDRVVLFGGEDPFTIGNLNDTWEWDGTAWTERALATRPSVRYGHAMAFDEQRGKVVLFGGAGAGTSGEETWELDSAGWVRRFPAPAPSWRYGHRMWYDTARFFPAAAFDRVRHGAVLFGGTSNFGDRLGGTWEYASRSRADFDEDGFVTGLDYDLFVLAFEAGDDRADFDGDGFVSGVDFDLYVVVYEAGC